MDTTCSIILAAGKGTRLKSDLPKVLHEILGQPLISYSLALASDLSERVIAVVGHGRDLVERHLATLQVETVVQEPQLGTGHAILLAADALRRTGASRVLILPGDMPLIRKGSLGGLLEAFHGSGADMGILTARIPDPTGYGRIVRNQNGGIRRIVEHQDASAGERAIDEVNTGVYVMNTEFLLSSVERLRPDNAKNELYLTDVVGMAGSVVSHTVPDPDEAHGINSRAQLAFAQERMQERINRLHMEEGVTIEAPAHTWIGPEVAIGGDVRIWPGVHILGKSRIERGVTIMPNVWIRDSTVGAGSAVGTGSIIENRIVGEKIAIPPLTYLD